MLFHSQFNEQGSDCGCKSNNAKVAAHDGMCFEATKTVCDGVPPHKRRICTLEAKEKDEDPCEDRQCT